MRTLVCRHCGRKVISNKKLKHLDQYYCGEKACQSARKRSFDRHKYETNELFRFNKLQSARDRKKKQGNTLDCSQYQRDYRASHPGYVADNRQKQRERNARKADKTIRETKIVNPDAFMSKIIEMELVTKTQPMFVRLL